MVQIQMLPHLGASLLRVDQLLDYPGRIGVKIRLEVGWQKPFSWRVTSLHFAYVFKRACNDLCDQACVCAATSLTQNNRPSP